MRGVQAPIAGGAGVLRRSSAAFCSAVPVLLFISLLLLCYRSAVHIAVSRVSSVLDSDPDVVSLLSRLSSAPASASSDGHPPRLGDRSHRGAGSSRRPRGRPPFLHLTRAGTLDDDFFSETDHVDGDYPLRRYDDRAFNSTIVVSHSHLLRLLGGGDESPRHPAARGIRVKVPPASPVLFVFTENGGERDREDGKRADGADIELRIFGQGFHLNRRDALALAYLMTLFSVVYFFATVGFLTFYSCAIGIVFMAVADSLLGRQRPFLKTVNAGCRLGARRVMGFVFLRCVVRDTLAQFLCILLFSDVNNQHSMLKLLVRVKLMPFLLTASPLTQWSPGDESSLWWFLLLWAVLDRIVALVFVFSCWVAVTDFNRRRRGPEVLWEGLRLVLTMMDRALFLRHVETMICWNSGRWILSAIGGPVFATIIQSVAEVYFMVVWLMCYFDMRCKEGELEGRRFGRRNLEDCIGDLR